MKFVLQLELTKVEAEALDILIKSTGSPTDVFKGAGKTEQEATQLSTAVQRIQLKLWELR